MQCLYFGLRELCPALDSALRVGLTEELLTLICRWTAMAISMG